MTRILWALAILAASAAPEPFMEGVATWYGEPHVGRTMQNGQPYDPGAMTCAVDISRWEQLQGAQLLVCTAQACVECRVTDTYYADGVDLSVAAFRQLAALGVGVASVRVWRQ